MTDHPMTLPADGDHVATHGDIVELYRAILRREPEPEGLADHLAEQRPYWLEVREFLESDEYQAIRARQLSPPPPDDGGDQGVRAGGGSCEDV